MEVFEEKQVVFEVGIFLKLGLVAVHGSFPIFISGKDGDAAERKLLGNHVQGEKFARSGWVFNG
jgi:hypothetical protein